MAPRVIAAGSIWRPAMASAVLAVFVTTIGYVAFGMVAMGTHPALLFLLPFILFPVGFVGVWMLRRVSRQ